MTPVTGALTINWVNQYVGLHRVCYRLGGSGAFTCISVNSPNPPGSANTTIIPVLVDNESCDVLTWEVYVQAECEDILSTDGRVYVNPSPTFTPTPTCLPQTLTCTDVPVASYTITNDGRDNADGGQYDGSETADIGGVPGFAITVGVGDPNDTFITAPGAGGTDAVYPAVPANNIVGAGVGATFEVTITGGVVSAVVSDVAGSGYLAGDTFNFVGGGVTGLDGSEIITVIESDLGVVLSITGPATLYTTAPVVVIDPPSLGPGTNAEAIAVLGNCPDGWDVGQNCDGTDYFGGAPFPTEVAQGITFDICYTDGTYNGADDLGTYGFTLTNSANCCYDCVDILIENDSGETVNYSYVDCATKEIQTASLADAANINIACVVNNSWSFDIDSVDIVVSTSTPATCS